MDAMAPAGSSDTPPAYVGLWPRLGAFLVDVLIFVPVIILEIWARAHYRMSFVWLVLGYLLIFAVYRVYLVGRFGATPGKMILGIEIRKVDGSPVGYSEAFLRGLPNELLDLIFRTAQAWAVLHLSDAQYLALSIHARTAYILSFNPALHSIIEIAAFVWILADIIVFFCNDERRALHDFVAGTVVVKAPVNL
jgi:uncharacterized RDD family membrane protein YckC